MQKKLLMPQLSRNRIRGWACWASLVSVWSRARPNPHRAVTRVQAVPSTAGYSRTSLTRKMILTISTVWCKTIFVSFRNKLRVKPSQEKIKAKMTRARPSRASKVVAWREDELKTLCLTRMCRRIQPANLTSTFRKTWTKRISPKITSAQMIAHHLSLLTLSINNRIKKLRASLVKALPMRYPEPKTSVKIQTSPLVIYGAGINSKRVAAQTNDHLTTRVLRRARTHQLTWREILAARVKILNVACLR